jgi:lysylphosphatidylglycerol synthetase-like protein (DUF2156 family)
MARHDVNDDYVRDLAAQLGPGSGRVVDEVRDHLLEAAHEHVERGADPQAADHAAIRTFGEPALVAACFVDSGLPRSTRFTRAAGVTGIAAAALVTTAVGLFAAAALAERTRPWDGLPSTLEGMAVLALVSGVALSTVASAGLLRRVGPLGGWALISVALMAVAAITSLLAWFPWVWATAFGCGVALLADRLRRSGIPPRWAVRQAVAGSLVAAAVPWLTVGLWRGSAVVLDVDLILLGIAVGMVVWASGAVVLGWWLVRECAQLPGMPRSRPSVRTL